MEGLKASDVTKSRSTNGSNALPEAEPKTFWGEFKESFGDPMIRILLAIAGIMIGFFIIGKVFPNLGITQTIYEPIGTLVAVVLVATISAKTAVGSDKSFRALKERTKKDEAKVLRDGKVTVVPFDDIVVGDVVLLQSGDKVPADGILAEGALKVNNSSLNGEAEECKKTANPDARVPDSITGDTFVDASSLFRGAIVVDGEGYMVVQKVGLATMMGKMAQEMTEDSVKSPLQVKLGKLANQISVFGYISAALIVVIYYTMGIVHAGSAGAFFGDWHNIVNTTLEAVDLAILIIVCAVPEGLPLMISLVLMQNTGKLLDHNVLVRKAQGIETAGSLNILFSDKTGTITKGHLEVVELFGGDGKEAKPSVNFLECVCKNTQSTISEGKVIGGNMTDQALMNYVLKNNLSAPLVGIIKEQGFNSTNKFSQAQLGNGRLVYKGAPEKLLTKCTKMLVDGEVVDFDRSVVDKKCDEMAKKAMRMLAFAYKQDAVLEENVLQDDLVLVAIAAIRDDVRPEARDAIKEVNRAGIQVVMITGDRLETAQAIARDAELIDENAVVLTDDNKSDMLRKYESTTTSTDKAGLVVSSEMLNKLSDNEIKTLVSGIRVISRALPTDKSRMVRICQEMNLVCGMTGDGVNDSPALKRADVGFAMGSGTEAAKEAGDLVILDDNFKSIKDAILFGRTCYLNVLKFVKFQLSMNVLAVLATLFSPILGFEAPLTVVMLLFVNLCCDSLASLMFGPEAPMDKYMTEKPRKRDESIISVRMLISIIVTSIWLAVLGFILMGRHADLTQYQIQALYFVFYIWGSLFNAFNCRTDGFDIFKGIKDNKNFVVIPALIVAAQAVIVCIGAIPALAPVGYVFGCAPISAQLWLEAIVLGLTVVPVGFLTKLGKKH